ncbi:phosphoribosylformylglycinamidine synthase subunit PurS [bacterium]|nr:phosphoribosylformylglycinamidine synthase subunit PurS [bacterium]
MKSKVIVTFKPGVLDPQGRAIQQLLAQHGYSQIKDVRVGKLIEFELDGVDSAQARTLLAEVSEQVLANPIIETFRIETE